MNQDMRAVSSDVEVFRNDDRSYNIWLTSHLRGFLISTRASKSDRPEVHFHSASCGVHARNAGSRAENPFTERYVKACSTSILALHAYAEKNYPDRPRHVCGCCKVALTEALGIAPPIARERSLSPNVLQFLSTVRGSNRKPVTGGSEGKALHPFIEGLLGTLPDPDAGGQWPLEMRITWLRAAANIFDLIYKCEGEITIELADK